MINPQFLVNSKGKETSVLLTVKDFELLVEAYEDLQDLKAYKKVKAKPNVIIDWEVAKKELKFANP